MSTILESIEKRVNFLKLRLSYVIGRYGLHKSQKKIDAINNIPRLTNCKEVRAFIRVIKYYGRFSKS